MEVIERAKSGFLGFGGNPAKVRVSYEVPGEDEEPSSPAPEKAPEPAAPKAEPVPEKKAEPVSPAPQAEKKAEPAPREDANRLQPGDEVLIGREETNAPKGMDGQPRPASGAGPRRRPQGRPHPGVPGRTHGAPPGGGGPRHLCE